jgi:hypothetical protein
VERHRRKVRFFSTIELVNTLEQEKAKGRAGHIAESLISSFWTSSYTCRSVHRVGRCCFICSANSTNEPPKFDTSRLI